MGAPNICIQWVPLKKKSFFSNLLHVYASSSSKSCDIEDFLTLFHEFQASNSNQMNCCPFDPDFFMKDNFKDYNFHMLLFFMHAKVHANML